jgi:nitronate monooxygenase
MWNRTPFAARLGLEWPIVQGPFGGGYSSVALAAAVSNGGGLGSFGAVALSPAQITDTVAALRAATPRPFAVNLWVPLPGEDAAISAEDFARAAARLAPYYARLGLEPPPFPVRVERFGDQVAALLEARPPVMSFIMGVPPRAVLDEARRQGIVTIGTATTVEEAVLLDEAGVELIVASGSDAGGHRGAFARPAAESIVGTFSLVPQVVDAVRAPVIAAGGIADGRGVVAALALGAAGVQVGTAFLVSPESAAPAVHKALLGTPAARDTLLTRVFSGRLARGIRNELARRLAPDEDHVPPYPVQSYLTAPLRSAAAAAEDRDHLALWAGQAAALARAQPAAEILARLVAEVDALLARSGWYKSA